MGVVVWALVIGGVVVGGLEKVGMGAYPEFQVNNIIFCGIIRISGIIW